MSKDLFSSSFIQSWLIVYSPFGSTYFHFLRRWGIWQKCVTKILIGLHLNIFECIFFLRNTYSNTKYSDNSLFVIRGWFEKISRFSFFRYSAMFSGNFTFAFHWITMTRHNQRTKLAHFDTGSWTFSTDSYVTNVEDLSQIHAQNTTYTERVIQAYWTLHH